MHPAEVTVLLVGTVLVVRPWVAELTPTVTYTHRSKSDTWPYKYKNEKRTLMVPEKGGAGITYGGLYTRVIKRLQDCKIPFKVEHHTDPLPEVDFSAVDELRGEQGEILAAVARSYRGLIVSPTAYGKSFMITQIVKMYPTQRILVTTPNKSVVSSLYRRLRAVRANTSMVDGSHGFRESSSVIVSTVASMHKVDVDWPDIVLFDECHGAGSPTAQFALTQLYRSRLFGFTASPDGRSDNADFMVEAFFGPPLVDIKYAEAVQSGNVSPIRVLVRRIKCPPITFKEGDDVDKERQGYWQNKARNQLIAAIMRKVKTEDQAMIMVKTTEHALRLQSLMPDIPVIHTGKTRAEWCMYIGTGAIANWCTPEEASRYPTEAALLHAFVKGDIILDHYARWGAPDIPAYLEAFESGALKRVISTTVWKEGIDAVHLRYLIRADGTTGAIPSTQIPGRLSRLAEGKKEGVLIDFIDDFGDTFLNRSMTRINGYRKKGWEVQEWK